jgi:hypothetical protein
MKEWLAIIVGYVLIFILPVLYFVPEVRFDLGLHKPTYKTGDCVSLDTSTEFEKHEIVEQIVEVGTKHYRTRSWSSSNHFWYGDYADRIGWIDYSWVKSDKCGK